MTMETTLHRAHTVRRILLGLIALLVVLTVFAMVFANIEGYRYSARIDAMQKGFLDIERTLEREGLNDALSGQVDTLAQQSEFVNLIVTDANGQVLYAANRTYLSGESGGTFYIYTNPNGRRNSAYMATAPNKIIGRIGISDPFSVTAAVQLTLQSPDLVEAFNQLSYDVSMYNDQYASYQASLGSTALLLENADYIDVYVRSANLAAKNMTLYLLSDSVAYANGFVDIMQEITQFLVVVTILLAIVALAMWTYFDAKSRGASAVLWGLLTLIANVFALAVYLVVRPHREACTACGAVMEPPYAACVRCGHKRPMCPECRRIVRLDWVACPTCGTALSDTKDGYAEPDLPEGKPMADRE